MMRIIIFGTGAMACLFGARLSQVAHVTLIGTWKEAIRAIRERGILVEDSHESRKFQVNAEYLGAQLMPADLVIVLVKSWQTKGAAEYLPRYLKSDGLAISLQNGLGNVELLGAKAFPGTTAEGATLLGPGHVRTGGSGPTHVVAPARIVELLKSAGFECHQCTPIEADGLLWGKLAISCGINALTAILRVPNGELLKRPSAADLMIRAATECSAVAHARGVRLPFADAAVRVREVAERTAANKSSMLQDVLRGAPTECDAINGAVVCEGRRLKVPAPVNEILWQLVKAAVEQKNRSDLQ
jgi:2-dehydropantoate 2-reductase